MDEKSEFTQSSAHQNLEERASLNQMLESSRRRREESQARIDLKKEEIRATQALRKEREELFRADVLESEQQHSPGKTDPSLDDTVPIKLDPPTISASAPAPSLYMKPIIKTQDNYSNARNGT